jgi:hypothetical protein
MRRQMEKGSRVRSPGKQTAVWTNPLKGGKFRLKRGGIPPELVDEIARRVYALLRAELKIERERERRHCLPARRNGG